MNDVCGTRVPPPIRLQRDDGLWSFNIFHNLHGDWCNSVDLYFLIFMLPIPPNQFTCTYLSEIVNLSAFRCPNLHGRPTLHPARSWCS